MYCSALWAEYTGGHGWLEYYKKNPESVFEEPAPSIEEEWNISLDENMINTWKNIVAKIPEQPECKIGEVIIPGDIMSFLKFIYKDEREINRWLYTFRDKTTQFITPINLLKEDGGMDAVRFLLLRMSGLQIQ